MEMLKLGENGRRAVSVPEGYKLCGSGVCSKAGDGEILLDDQMCIFGIYGSVGGILLR